MNNNKHQQTGQTSRLGSGHQNETVTLKPKLFTISLALVTFVAGSLLGNSNLLSTTSLIKEQQQDKVPLYWVAPMDTNYRRDKPGVSPMGMELIPVYQQMDSHAAGEVVIPPNLQQNFSVKTAQVMPRIFQRNISTFGVVQYDEDHLVHVHTRVEGWIEKLYINAVGDKVKKGQPLFDIYSPTLANAQEELLLALQRNSQPLAEAAKQRLRALHVTEQTIDEIIQTRQVRQTIPRFASQSGVISKLAIREGFYVKPDKTLMAIAALDPIWVIADVMAQDTAQVFKNMPASMSFSSTPNASSSFNLRKEGVVEYIYPELEPDSRVLKVRLRFANADELLKPNMYSEIQLYRPPYEAALTIPKQAVIYEAQETTVVVKLDTGRFKSVSVKLGQQDGGFIEVLSGLAFNDAVVTSGQFLIDSESRKHSDFLRWGMTEHISQPSGLGAAHSNTSATQHISSKMMKHSSHNDSIVNARASNPQANQSTLESATVNGILIAKSGDRLTIDREEIPQWNRAAARVNFQSTVSSEALNIGQKLFFTFEVRETGLVITQIHSSPHRETSHSQHNKSRSKRPTSHHNPEKGSHE